MNRRKKGNQILKTRARKANAKLAPPSKVKYISKADRQKLEAEPTLDTAVDIGRWTTLDLIKLALFTLRWEPMS